MDEEDLEETEGAWTKDIQVIASSHPPVERSGHRHVARGGSHAWVGVLSQGCHYLAVGLRSVVSFLSEFHKNCSVVQDCCEDTGKYVLD